MKKQFPPYFLYRLYSEKGDLLYIGRTIDLLKRMRQHKMKEWFHEVHCHTIERYGCRIAAKYAEKIAIYDEHPKYNIVYKTLPSKCVEGYMRNYIKEYKDKK